MVLIADSGSTKTAWCGLQNGCCKQHLLTSGINPFYMNSDEIKKELEILSTKIDGIVEQIYFYGAGVASPEKTAQLQTCFQAVFPGVKIEAHTDLFGAARALCGHEKGIVCILGTGSNSCFYDGTDITDNVPALGFILGDEGSGAALGKKLVSDILKRQLPTHLQRIFFEKYCLTKDMIMERVYRQPFPNRFLASFTDFLHEHQSESCIQSLLRESFDLFFVRNVMHYDFTQYPVHLLGSIAFYFQNIIRDTAQKRGVEIGLVAKTAIDGLIIYHS